MSGTALLISWLLTYRYLVVLPLTIIEGPIVMLVSGFLIRLGFFDFLPIYLLLVAGDFLADIIWYYIGYFGARPIVSRFGKFLSISMEDIERFETLFKKHETKIILFSKVTMGFGFALATLAAAGAAKVSIKKYALLNIIGGFVWTGMLVTAGFFLGNVYLAVNNSLRIAFLIAIIIMVIAAIYGFSKYMRTNAGEALLMND